MPYNNATLKKIHWKYNLFKIPTGKAEKLVVLELLRLIHVSANNSALKSVALKAATAT